MKVLFLDIDGVLNSPKYIRRIGELFDDPQYQIDPDAVVRLNRITDATGAGIVVSSSWRLVFIRNGADKLPGFLTSYGITGQCLGMTPDLSGRTSPIPGVDTYDTYYMTNRGLEIRSWLDDHSEVTSFIVLDDKSVKGMEDHLLQTYWNGLEDEHIDLAIDKLNGKTTQQWITRPTRF